MKDLFTVIYTIILVLAIVLTCFYIYDTHKKVMSIEKILVEQQYKLEE